MKRRMHRKHDELSSRHFWFKGRQEIVELLLSKLKMGTGSCLEIGIGTGNMLNTLKRRGFSTVDGVEVFKRAVKGYHNIYWAPFEKALIRGEYDAVFMFDSLEHIRDDRGAIAKAGSLLKRRGHIVITAPAYQWLWSKHDEENMHFRRYGMDYLRKMLEREGFAVENATYFSTLLFPLVVLSRAFGKGGLGEVHPVLNEVLYRIFSLEKHAASAVGLPFGSSIFIAARKL